MSSSSKDIFIPVFSGKHFDHWSVKMKTVLISEGLWEYVEEGYEAPNPTLMLTAEQKQQFGENRRNDGKALSIIQRGVSSKFFRKILNAKTAKEAWDILHKDLQMDASTTAAQKVDNAPRPEPMLSSSSTSLTEHGIIPLVEKPLNDLLHSKSNIEPPYPLMDASTTAAQKVDNAPRPEPMLNSSSTSLIEHEIIPLVEKPLNDLLHSKSNIEPPYPLMDASTTAAQKVDNAPRPEPMLNSSSTSLIEHEIIPLVEKPLNDLLHSKSNIEPPFPLMDVSTTTAQKVDNAPRPEPMLNSSLIEHGIIPLVEKPLNDLLHSKSNIEPPYPLMDVSTTTAQKVDNAPRPEPVLNSSLIEHGIIPLVEKPLNDLLHSKSNIEPPYPLMDVSTTTAQKVDNAPRPEPVLNSSLIEHGIIPLVEKPLNDLLHSKSNIEPPYPLMDVSTTTAQKVDNAPRPEPVLNSSLIEHGIIPLVEKPLNDLLHSKSNIEPPYPLMDVSTTTAQKVDNAPRLETMLNSSLIEHGIIPLVEKPLNDLLHSKSNIEPPYPLKVEGISKPQPMLSSPDITHLDEERITPLLELPFYDLLLSEAQVGPTYQMSFPPRLDSALPSITVPAIIKCFGKTWELKFCGDMTPKGFDSSWRKFVDDNNLVVDDAVIFELLESSSVKVMFKVQFLRCKIPPEMQESINKKRAKRPAITIDDK